MIHDEKAEKLEQAGFYRRAAVRWLTVLDNCHGTAEKHGDLAT
ncbi:PerC family transcriptional regulator [Salmonella enterica]|nr:PerC family transcriptional regulator [Salmonella enterica]